MEDRLMNWNNLQKVLEEYAITVRNKYQDNLINSNRIASGKLLNSIDFIIEKDNQHISVSLKLEDYWKYVEYDTKPHWPPVDKILEWIKIKPILPRPDRKGNLPTPNQLAFLIGRKISEDGTTGTKDLHSAIEEINTEFEIRIQEAITKDLESGFSAIFTEFFRGSE